MDDKGQGNGAVENEIQRDVEIAAKSVLREARATDPSSPSQILLTMISMRAVIM